MTVYKRVCSIFIAFILASCSTTHRVPLPEEFSNTPVSLGLYTVVPQNRFEVKKDNGSVALFTTLFVVSLSAGIILLPLKSAANTDQESKMFEPLDQSFSHDSHKQLFHQIITNTLGSIDWLNVNKSIAINSENAQLMNINSRTDENPAAGEHSLIVRSNYSFDYDIGRFQLNSQVSLNKVKKRKNGTNVYEVLFSNSY